jgi:hypothetical protein
MNDIDNKNMQEAHKLMEVIEDASSNVVPWVPRVVTGGKGPPTGDWLSDLPDGTRFLCRPKQNQPMEVLACYEIIARSNKGIMLYSDLNESRYFWIDPVLFSRVVELYEVLEGYTP